MHTTLNTIKSHTPCVEGWKTLLKGLNKLEADDEPLHLSQILSINGADDALWSLRAFSIKDCQLFAIGAARQVKNLSISSENLLNMAEACVLQVPVNGVRPPILSELRTALSKVDGWTAAAWAAWGATVVANAAGVGAVVSAVNAANAAANAANAAMAAGALMEEVIKEACAYVEARRG